MSIQIGLLDRRYVTGTGKNILVLSEIPYVKTRLNKENINISFDDYIKTLKYPITETKNIPRKLYSDDNCLFTIKDIKIANKALVKIHESIEKYKDFYYKLPKDNKDIITERGYNWYLSLSTKEMGDILGSRNIKTGIALVDFNRDSLSVEHAMESYNKPNEFNNAKSQNKRYKRIVKSKRKYLKSGNKYYKEASATKLK